jgi:EAL domain-containing protein (putative c-di-GMP-specific phosphodiesterase class I)
VEIPSFRDAQPEIAAMMRDQGALGVLLFDFHHLGRVERQFGGSAYQGLWAQVQPILHDVQAQVRTNDILVRDERDTDLFLLFLAARRQGKPTFVAGDIRKLCDRLEEFVTPRVARLTLPYFRDRPRVDVGYGFVLWTPLEGEDRQILRLVDEAQTSVLMRRAVRDRDERESLLQIIYNHDLWTAFQPIVEMESGQVMGFEALARGPRGTDLEFPSALFGLASRFGMGDELERACRRQSFIDWQAFGAPARLFINTVPATVRDTSFLGRGVLDYLGPTLSPRFVTLEITEGQVIANINLYREAMHSFTELGFTFAIDDLGAGYSGLETLATLGASYLKIDMGLVRDVHQKRVNQQVVKAILELGAGVGATVIAEGIETKEEAETLRSIGLRYAQGYLFGRPRDPQAKAPISNAG